MLDVMASSFFSFSQQKIQCKKRNDKGRQIGELGRACECIRMYLSVGYALSPWLSEKHALYSLHYAKLGLKLFFKVNAAKEDRAEE